MVCDSFLFIGSITTTPTDCVILLSRCDTLFLTAVIEGKEIVYRDYIDISVAVATPKVRLVGKSFLCMYYLDIWPLLDAFLSTFAPPPNTHTHTLLSFLFVQGLVVPVLRNVESMNYADIELGIAELGEKVQNSLLIYVV